MSDSCAIVSGGLDSTTLVYDMLDKGYRPHLLSFDYGQRHKKELTFARATAQRLGLEFHVIDLRGITELISNSALTSLPSRTYELLTDGENLQVGKPVNMYDVAVPAIEVPEGHYAEDTMKQTVVPNRNMIMLSIAAGVAVNNKYKTIGFGVHSGDHFIYPDCRPRFVVNAGWAILSGNEGFHHFEEHLINPPGEEESTPAYTPIYAPFLHKTKADIAYRALELGVPIQHTWSCYKGGENHCGRCGTCVERLEAIDEACDRFGLAKEGRVVDKTVYDDSEYWKVAVREAADRTP